MGKVEHLSINLSAEFVDLMNDAIAGGEYVSVDHLLSAALGDWKSKREDDMQRLKDLLAAGVASGLEPHDGMQAIKEEARKLLDGRAE